MNVFTINLNNYYNSPGNRYSYIRNNIVHKLNSIQLLILTYCDNKACLFLNKSWLQFLTRNKDFINRYDKNQSNINNQMFDNQLISYKINKMMTYKKCDHVYKHSSKYGDVKFCIKCNRIIDSDIVESPYKKYKY